MLLDKIIKNKKVNDLEENQEKSLDIPKIEFENLEDAVTIGQWLGLLKDLKGIVTTELTMYTHLSAKEFLQKFGLPKSLLSEIKIAFGKILKEAGINSDEECLITSKDECDYNCCLKKSNENVKFELSWGNMIDFGPEIKIDYKNESKRYEYYYATEKHPAEIKLRSYTKSNPKSNNYIKRYISQFRYFISLESKNTALNVTIKCPDNFDITKSFYIDKESEFENYLFNLDFPIDINEIYKKLCEYFSIDTYPLVEINVEKKDEKNKRVITDLLTLKHGELLNLIKTKSDKKISVATNGWAYSDSKYVISKDENGLMSFNILKMKENELRNISSLEEKLNDAQSEIEQERKLMLDLIKNKN